MTVWEAFSKLGKPEWRKAEKLCTEWNKIHQREIYLTKTMHAITIAVKYDGDYALVWDCEPEKEPLIKSDNLEKIKSFVKDMIETAKKEA